MAQYINKSAVVAEIERRIKVLQNHPKENHKTICHLDAVKQFLDTLEVEEVDLEKEIELVKGDYEQVDVGWNNDFEFIARHFFELGLQAQKGE